MTNRAEKPGIEYLLPVTCMIEAHGPLIGYQAADGKIAIRACDYCLNIARQEGMDSQEIAWKRKISEALDG